MKTGFHQTGTVVLSCNHVIKLVVPLPANGELQYCRRCEDYLTVTGSYDSYRVKCNTGRCRLGRDFRADKDAAMAAARKHVQQYSRHKVSVFAGLITVAEITNTEETLFATADDRAAIAAESQKLLRNLGLRGTANPPGMG